MKRQNANPFAEANKRQTRFLNAIRKNTMQEAFEWQKSTEKPGKESDCNCHHPCNAATGQCETEHLLATVITSCNQCDKWRNCFHIKSHFQSTKDSKRLVHVYFFWKMLLGPQFPVTDSMLREDAWKNLESLCDLGVKKQNGHAKQTGGPVCINPAHYQVIDKSKMVSIMNDTAVNLFSAHEAVMNDIMELNSRYFGQPAQEDEHFKNMVALMFRAGNSVAGADIEPTLSAKKSRDCVPRDSDSPVSSSSPCLSSSTSVDSGATSSSFLTTTTAASAAATTTSGSGCGTVSKRPARRSNNAQRRGRASHANRARPPHAHTTTAGNSNIMFSPNVALGAGMNGLALSSADMFASVFGQQAEASASTVTPTPDLQYYMVNERTDGLDKPQLMVINNSHHHYNGGIGNSHSNNMGETSLESLMREFASPATSSAAALPNTTTTASTAASIIVNKIDNSFDNFDNNSYNYINSNTNNIDSHSLSHTSALKLPQGTRGFDDYENTNMPTSFLDFNSVVNANNSNCSSSRSNSMNNINSSINNSNALDSEDLFLINGVQLQENQIPTIDPIGDGPINLDEFDLSLNEEQQRQRSYYHQQQQQQQQAETNGQLSQALFMPQIYNSVDCSSSSTANIATNNTNTVALPAPSSLHTSPDGLFVTDFHTEEKTAARREREMRDQHQLQQLNHFDEEMLLRNGQPRSRAEQEQFFQHFQEGNAAPRFGLTQPLDQFAEHNQLLGSVQGQQQQQQQQQLGLIHDASSYLDIANVVATGDNFQVDDNSGNDTLDRLYAAIENIAVNESLAKNINNIDTNSNPRTSVSDLIVDSWSGLF